MKGSGAREDARSVAGMQALILVGGEGTRLRPLTSTVPKPVVTLVDRPFMAYMLEWLSGHGVDDVVLACGFMPARIREVLGDGESFGIRLRYLEEPTPLGTAGAAKFAADLLDERFLMLNGDVLTDIDLSAQIAQHEATGARATLALVPVHDPSAYGLVRLAEDRAVTGFVEKPTPDQIDTNLINAGAYVLQREILNPLIADQPSSIERDVFPLLVGDGLFGFPADAYWLDIGTPERYLKATFDILERRVRTLVGERLGSDGLAIGEKVSGSTAVHRPAVIGDRCQIGAGACVGELAVLGADVEVGERASIRRSVVLDGAVIGADCVLDSCIVGPRARIGQGTQISGEAVVGEGVTVGSDNVLGRGVRIFPGMEIPDATAGR
ncbi:MAG: NDP-sugar synthase [Solirubrobacterales bacterium]|nr:NDP-sugar synthase [Solirubrobacterales bacterium]